MKTIESNEESWNTSLKLEDEVSKHEACRVMYVAKTIGPVQTSKQHPTHNERLEGIQSRPSSSAGKVGECSIPNISRVCHDKCGNLFMNMRDRTGKLFGREGEGKIMGDTNDTCQRDPTGNLAWWEAPCMFLEFGFWIWVSMVCIDPSRTASVMECFWIPVLWCTRVRARWTTDRVAGALERWTQHARPRPPNFVDTRGNGNRRPCLSCKERWGGARSKFVQDDIEAFFTALKCRRPQTEQWSWTLRQPKRWRKSAPRWTARLTRKRWWLSTGCWQNDRRRWLKRTQLTSCRTWWSGRTLRTWQRQIPTIPSEISEAEPRTRRRMRQKRYGGRWEGVPRAALALGDPSPNEMFKVPRPRRDEQRGAGVC